MLKMILLGFLNYTPMTGYDLKRVIDLSITNFWHAHHSQIYTTLRKMEAEALVESETEEQGDKLNRRVYHITEAGRETLHAWLAEPLDHLPATKNDHMVRLFFSAMRDRDTVLDELRIQRQLRQQRLAHYQNADLEHMVSSGAGDAADLDPAALLDRLRPDLGYWKLVLDYGIAYETLYIQTIDAMITWVEANT